MTTLNLIAIGIALAAVAGLCAGLPDSWFCALLALSCLIGGADAAYRDLQPWPVVLLLAGALFTGAAVHAVIRDSHERRQQP